MGKLKKTLSEIPIEYIEISKEIISEAKIDLGKELSDNLYISLPDHIQFAVQRFKQGLIMQNRLALETKRMYKEEYAFAKKKLEDINRKFNVTLPEDEAANIVTHIINAELNSNMQDTMKMIEMVQSILSIIKKEMNINFVEDSLDYYRLVTHLKFFYQRLFSGEVSIKRTQDNQLMNLVKERYKRSFRCAKKIKKYLDHNEHVSINDDDLLYLTIHIEKVSTEYQ